MLRQPAALTRWTRSREKMWILQVTVDRVQMIVERMLRPHALNRRSCGGKYSSRDYKSENSHSSKIMSQLFKFSAPTQTRSTTISAKDTFHSVPGMSITTVSTSIAVLLWLLTLCKKVHAETYKYGNQIPL